MLFRVILVIRIYSYTLLNLFFLFFSAIFIASPYWNKCVHLLSVILVSITNSIKKKYGRYQRIIPLNVTEENCAYFRLGILVAFVILYSLVIFLFSFDAFFIQQFDCRWAQIWAVTKHNIDCSRLDMCEKSPNMYYYLSKF